MEEQFNGFLELVAAMRCAQRSVAASPTLERRERAHAIEKMVDRYVDDVCASWEYLPNSHNPGVQ